MVLIKVQYDAYNRQFKLVDRELVHVLDDGEIYILIADVSLEDLKSPGDTAAAVEGAAALGSLQDLAAGSVQEIIRLPF